MSVIKIFKNFTFTIFFKIPLLGCSEPTSEIEENDYLFLVAISAFAFELFTIWAADDRSSFIMLSLSFFFTGVSTAIS